MGQKHSFPILPNTRWEGRGSLGYIFVQIFYNLLSFSEHTGIEVLQSIMRFTSEDSYVSNKYFICFLLYLSIKND